MGTETGVMSLVNLARNQRQKKEREKETQLAQDQAQEIVYLREVFSVQVWGFLGANPDNASFLNGNPPLVLSFPLTVEGWPFRVCISSSAKRVQGAVRSFKIEISDPKVEEDGFSSSRDCHHNNAVLLGWLIEKAIERAQANRDRQIINWCDTLRSSYVGLDKWEPHIASLDTIPNLPAWKKDELLRLAEAHRQTLLEAQTVSAERKQKQLVLARKIIRAAKQHQKLLTDYYNACQKWAEEQTAKLWSPWMLYRVSYVPVRIVRGTDDGYAGDEMIEFVHTMTDPKKIAKECPAEVEEITRSGGVEPGLLIGAFLNARPLVFDKPSMEEGLDFHRHCQAAGFFVNIPAYIEARPDPAPNPPVSLEGSLKKLGIQQSIGAYSSAELAKMTPEKVVEVLYLWR